MTALLKTLFNLTSRFGILAIESDEVRFQKSLLILATLFLVPISFIWGSVYYWYGETDAGIWTFVFSGLSLLNLLSFKARKSFEFFYKLQILLILLFPFIIRTLLGGYVNGGAIILWAFIAPLGASLLKKTFESYLFLGAFIGLTILSGFLDKFIVVKSVLPQNIVLTLYLLNIIMVTSICFALINYYLEQANIFKKQLERLRFDIDQVKRQEELLSLTQTEFFKKLEEAAKLKKSDLY